MANWNPNSTNVKGMEWFPRVAGVVALDSNLKMAAMSMDTANSQAITQIAVANSGIPVRGGIYAVEAYDNETGLSDSVLEVEALPNEDVSAGGWLNQAGSGANLYQSIDEASNAVNVTDWIRRSGTYSVYTGRLNTAALSLTGKRILAIRFNAYVAMGPGSQLFASLNLGASNYTMFHVYGPFTARWVNHVMRYNPATNKPWTIADVQAFDSTDEFLLGAVTASGWSAVDVFDVVMTVIYCTENRLAVGVLDDSASALTPNAYNFATVLTPTGGAWTKDATGRHLYTIRRIGGSGSMNIPYLDAVDAAAPIGSGWAPTLNANYGQITAMGSALTRMHGVLPCLTGPTASVDSQPYWKLTNASVYLFQDAQQEFSNAAAAAYGVIRVLLKPGNADMTITCKRRSDNVQLGGTYTLTPAAALAMPDLGLGDWRMVKVQLPSSGTLAAGVQYYLNFSAGVVTGASWEIMAADTANVGNAATFGGTTDQATIASVEYPYIDLTATISTIPTAPAGFTGVLGAQTVDETLCCIDEIARADLAWTATALGGSFLRYEIQRSEDAGATWTDIAAITTEATNSFKDYEAIRGISVTYRIRVLRTDLAFSAWSTSAGVTKPLGVDHTLYLVSNFDPTLNLAYDFRPARIYDFNENEERVTRAVYLRDYQLGFSPLEYRGTTAHYTLQIGLDDKVPPGGGLGIAGFDPLRDLARAQLPYVCVLDYQGNRLYASLMVPAGDHDESGRIGRYLTDLAAVEVASAPYVVTL